MPNSYLPCMFINYTSCPRQCNILYQLLFILYCYVFHCISLFVWCYKVMIKKNYTAKLQRYSDNWCRISSVWIFVFIRLQNNFQKLMFFFFRWRWMKKLTIYTAKLQRYSENCCRITYVRLCNIFYFIRQDNNPQICFWWKWIKNTDNLHCEIAKIFK